MLLFSNLRGKRIIVGLLLFSLVGISICFGLDLLDTHGNEVLENVVSSDYQYYSPDFNTIIEDIKRGNLAALIKSETSEPPPGDDAPETMVVWTAGEYLILANSVHELLWGEPVDDWYVNYITLNSECSNIEEGFEATYFQYYKTEAKGWRTRRYVSTIWISPSNNEVSITRDEIFPTKVKWKGFAYKDLVYTGDQIVKSTELEGGKEFREFNSDECEVSLNFTSQTWSVTYSSKKSGSIDSFLKFRISPDGELLEIKSD